MTAEFLYNMIVDSKSKSVIEVGTSNGYSGIWLGKALKQTGGKLLQLLNFMTAARCCKRKF